MQKQVEKVPLRLGINIDHIATLRNARGGRHPCPVKGAQIAKISGADGITAHLREDRRHIKDEDIFRLKNEVDLPLNLEMAATEAMLEIALNVKPHAVCIVPEKREELTTEGGLDIIGNQEKLKPIIAALHKQSIRVSLFVEASIEHLEVAKYCNADIVELHTGAYCQPSLSATKRQNELIRIQKAAEHAYNIDLECHAGHGLDYQNVGAIAAIQEIVELNIGHFLMGESMFVGLSKAIAEMRRLMDKCR